MFVVSQLSTSIDGPEIEINILSSNETSIKSANFLEYFFLVCEITRRKRNIISFMVHFNPCYVREGAHIYGFPRYYIITFYD